MAETKKLSVEKALNKIRSADETKTRSERRDEDMDELDEEIKRMRRSASASSGVSASRNETGRGRT